MTDRHTVFYSWQSDLANRTNHGFIEDCLRRAVQEVISEGILDVEPVIDRDVQGTGGALPISEVILDKIESCAVFVGDVSMITGKNASRPSPNPNVLIELGYAAKAVGFGRIIMVLNRAFGPPEDLPFDLRIKKAVTYDLTEDEQDKSTARKTLVAALRRELLAILPTVPSGTSAGPLGITIRYEVEKQENCRHEYRLEILVVNQSTERVDDYHIDIQFPAEVCTAPGSRDSFVKDRSNRDYVFFRVTPDLLGGPLYPGDKKPIRNILYHVDDATYHDRQRIFAKTVEVTAFVKGAGATHAEKPFQELQSF